VGRVPPMPRAHPSTKTPPPRTRVLHAPRVTAQGADAVFV
jgi:hypothetical protein